ncbi:MAG: CRISPR-associated helicase Cas3' [bacterium]|nr:CRISPR-associated helicase Cas3' [bacterium]
MNILETKIMLYSHPDKYLIDHLRNTANISKKLYSNIFVKNNIMGLNKDELIDISLIIAYYHDLGKATKYFQEYLFETNNNKKNKLKVSPLTKHSLISAILAFFALKEYLIPKNISEELRYIIPYIGFIVIKKHHSYLENLYDNISIDKNNIDILKEQLNSIEENLDNSFFNEIPYLEKSLNNTKNLLYNYNEFHKYFNKVSFCEMYKKIFNLNEKVLGLGDENSLYELAGKYIFTFLIMSILLFADRRDAANIQLFYFNQDFIDYDIFDDYVNNLNKNTLNQDVENNNNQFLKLRQETYNKIKQEILNDLFDNIIGVNLPTGIGKTLINLNLALKIKEKIKSNFNYHPKVIYSLPFLSIIDQVDELIKKAFNFKKINLTSNLYISHHYLSKFEYKIDNSDENIEYLDLLKGELMIENWDSHIVLTTFVKLFETITKNKVSTLMRFYNLISSIVILDEVQNIPYKYYSFLNTIFKALSYYFNNYFILSTATKPIILQTNKTLAYKELYINLNRVKINFNIYEDLTLQDLKNKLLDVFKYYRNILVILNTIRSAKEFYKLLKQEIIDNQIKIYFLSSHIIPKQRLQIIKDIKNRVYDNYKQIVVSTQLIEAGVDLDFDYAIRDFGPLDSIIQVAGRTNRNYNNLQPCNIDIYKILDEKNQRYFYSYIYDKILTENTINMILEINSNEIYEKDFYNIYEIYNNLLINKVSKDISYNLINHLKELNFGNISLFDLIEQKYIEYPIFIEIDENAINIWQEYCDIISNLKKGKDYYKQRERFLKIKSEFYSYVINVSYTYAKENLPVENNGFLYVCNSMLENYYDKETGFIPKNEDLLLF